MRVKEREIEEEEGKRRREAEKGNCAIQGERERRDGKKNAQAADARRWQPRAGLFSTFEHLEKPPPYCVLHRLKEERRSWKIPSARPVLTSATSVSFRREDVK